MSARRVCPQCRVETDDPVCPVDGYQTVVFSEGAAGGEDALIGTVFEGRYQIEARIGKGGFGAVYRAIQLGIGREVAIKVLDEDNVQSLADIARFQQEGRALATLKHPNIVDVYDFGQSADGALFMVMELLRGATLDQWLARHGPMSGPEIVEVAAQVADALADAHQAGIVHRDLKPQNIFLAEGARGRTTVKILDFGIARVSGDTAASMALTKTGQILGSPPYMSPEQCSGRPVTTQSDLYSLGCVLYECITGRRIFAHTTTTAYLIAHCTEPPDPPERDGLPVSGPLMDLVTRLLEKSPQDRPAGAEALQRELQELGDEPLIGGAPSGSAGRPMFERGGTTSKRLTAVAQRTATGRPAVAATGIARDARPRKRGVWPIAIGLGAVAAVALAVVALLPRGGVVDAAPNVPAAPVAAASPAPEAKPVAVTPLAKPAPEPVAAAPAPKPAPEPVAAAPAPKPVAVAPVAPAPKRLRLESTPSVASVTRDGAVLGTTPLEVTWTGDVPPTLKLEARGHKPLTVALAAEDAERGERRVVLEKIRAVVKPVEPTPTTKPSW